MSLSTVIVSRNDNYGSDLKKRAYFCLLNAIEQSDEIVYVDWKPFNNISLMDTLRNDLPKTEKIKHIKVERDFILQNLPEFINYPIIETIGRNIGVRRTTKDWVLSTNIDIIFNRPAIDKYDPNCFYVGRRRDIPIHHYSNFSKLTEIKQLINNNVYQQMPRSVIDGKSVWDPGDCWSLVVCCGDFQIAHKKTWNKIKGFEESFKGRCFADGVILKKAIFMGTKTDVDDEVLVHHLKHDSSKNTEPLEYLPNNTLKGYLDWEKTSNTEEWGFSNYNFNIEII